MLVLLCLDGCKTIYDHIATSPFLCVCVCVCGHKEVASSVTGGISSSGPGMQAGRQADAAGRRLELRRRSAPGSRGAAAVCWAL